MKTLAAPIPFAGSQLGEARHVCAFFNSGDEEYRVLLPFIKDGFECGDKAVHIVDPDRMLEVFEQLASGNAKGGFPLSRIVCHMDWAAEGRSYVDNLVEFESRVNDVWRRHDDAVICVYDLAKFGGDTVVDIMRTHPVIIIGGILQQNPFFVPPEKFLRELRERRAGQTTSPSKAV